MTPNARNWARETRDWHGRVRICWSTCRSRSQCTGNGSRDKYPGKSIGMLVWLCRDDVRKAKVQLELNLARQTKNKKGFTGVSARKKRSKKGYQY